MLTPSSPPLPPPCGIPNVTRANRHVWRHQWFESGGFHNWTVSNNTMTGCGGAYGGMGDVFVAACAPDWSDGAPLSSGNPVTTGQPFAGISIVDNTFKQLKPQSAVAIWGSAGLTISGNTVELVTRDQTHVPSIPRTAKEQTRPSSKIASTSRGEAELSHRTETRAGVRPTPHSTTTASLGANLDGSFDGFALLPDGTLNIHGWVVDSSIPATTPSNISIEVDGKEVATALANYPRPDLVPKVTSDPHHGFDLDLPNTTHWVANHTIQVRWSLVCALFLRCLSICFASVLVHGTHTHTHTHTHTFYLSRSLSLFLVLLIVAGLWHSFRRLA
jgi:hypothetical protein